MELCHLMCWPHSPWSFNNIRFKFVYLQQSWVTMDLEWRGKLVSSRSIEQKVLSTRKILVFDQIVQYLRSHLVVSPCWQMAEVRLHLLTLDRSCMRKVWARSSLIHRAPPHKVWYRREWHRRSSSWWNGCLQRRRTSPACVLRRTIRANRVLLYHNGAPVPCQHVSQWPSLIRRTTRQVPRYNRPAWWWYKIGQ
jgi:hypothetical protein